MRHLLRRLRSDHGQFIVMTVITMSVIFVMGFIVVDFGLWFSERRGAQKDADLSAVAAAQELLGCTSLGDPQASAVQQAANDRAWEYAQLNDVTDPENVHLPDVSDSSLWTGCWEDEGDNPDIIDSFPLDIEHPTGALFGTIFDLFAPEDLGAHARACVGSVVSMKGVMPVGVPINNPDYERWSRVLCWGPDDDGDGEPEPLYGKSCDLSVFDKVSGEASWLDLDHPDPDLYPPSDVCSESGGGANELGDEIEDGGANTVCWSAPIGFDAADCNDDLPYCVRSKTGAQPQKVMSAFNSLFSSEGECDITGDEIDDFAGSWEHKSGTPGTKYARYTKICDSPRLINLIIVDSYDPTGQSLMPIRYFASFFVEACRIDDVDYAKCDPQGNIGHANLVGKFLQIEYKGPVGYPTDWSPLRIVLDE